MLARLYRPVCCDLLLVQSREWGRRLELYLNDLVAQGHSCLYRSRPGSIRSLLKFVAHSFPMLLRVRSVPYLPLCVLLEDVDLQDMAERVPASFLEAYHTAAAASILNGQAQQVTALCESGIMIVSTSPQQLTERLISDYLTIKARNQM